MAYRPKEKRYGLTGRIALKITLELNEEELWTTLENSINQYSHLKSALPDGYPRKKKFNISPEKISWYLNNRSDKTWDHVNLPVTLLNNISGEENRGKPFAISTLSTLDRYCKEFNSLPGFKKVLGPLWNSAWDLGDACFWSVFGEVSLALLLYDRGYKVFGFDQNIGSGAKTCDIKTEHNGKPVNMDIEIKHLNFDLIDDHSKLRSLLEGYANAKMQKKFANLPNEEFGVIAQIYMPYGKNLPVMSNNPNALDPVHYQGNLNQFAHLYWFAGGVKNNVFGVYLLDNKTAHTIKK